MASAPKRTQRLNITPQRRAEAITLTRDRMRVLQIDERVLARRAGLSMQTLRSFFRPEEGGPSISTLTAIAKGLDVAPGPFIQWVTGVDGAPTPSADVPASVQLLAEALTRLPAEDRALVEAMIRRLEASAERP